MRKVQPSSSSAPGIIQYVLNTGYELEFTEKAVAPQVIDRLRPLTRHGGPLPHPFDDFKVEVAHTHGGALFTLSRGTSPVTTSGLAWTEAGAVEIWKYLEGLYLDLSDRFRRLMAAEHAPTRTSELPWLGVVYFLAFLSAQITEWRGSAIFIAALPRRSGRNGKPRQTPPAADLAWCARADVELAGAKRQGATCRPFGDGVVTRTKFATTISRRR